MTMTTHDFIAPRLIRHSCHRACIVAAAVRCLCQVPYVLLTAHTQIQIECHPLSNETFRIVRVTLRGLHIPLHSSPFQVIVYRCQLLSNAANMRRVKWKNHQMK